MTNRTCACICRGVGYLNSVGAGDRCGVVHPHPVALRVAMALRVAKAPGAYCVGGALGLALGRRYHGFPGQAWAYLADALRVSSP